MLPDVPRHLLALQAFQAVALAVVPGSSHAPPRGWSAAWKPASGAMETFTIALAMRNMDQLESRLLSVSTPGSDLYGQFMDVDQVNAVFAPSDAAVNDVLGWLRSHNISDYAVDGAFVDFLADVPTADALLNASYHYYDYAATAGMAKLRTTSYSIPDGLRQHVVLVYPSTYFGAADAASFGARADRTDGRVRGTKTSADEPCRTSVTPACLKSMYSVDDYKPDVRAGSSVGFASFLNQSAIYADLAQFEHHFNIPQQNLSVEVVAGGIDNQSTTQFTEANLDAQALVGIAHPLPVVEYITGGSPPFIPNIDHKTASRNFNEPWVPYYRHLLSKPNRELPQVLSHSYGEQEDSVPHDYAVLTCNLVALMGLRGITILQSSGDSGVGSGCLAPDFATVEFYPIFPASCPWLTSVGGTVGVAPETAWEGSSGGFSRYFKRPAYQDAAVSRYLETVDAETRAYFAGYTDWSGRGFPDVAAHSLAPSYQVVYRGRLSASGGTSAAAPVWAGVVALLNDARLRSGRSRLGWLNPLIYSVGWSALNDVVDGFAAGCNGTNPGTGAREPAGAGMVPGARWNATAGWDPTTGFGTPNFQKLNWFLAFSIENKPKEEGRTGRRGGQDPIWHSALVETLYPLTRDPL